MMGLRIKRVYDGPDPDDGYRVLVDRLWPRGINKARAAIDLWCKEVAPSSGLRTWFDHRSERYDQFAARYVGELSSKPAVDQLREVMAANPTVTLVYGAKDEAVNHAAVLADHLMR
jgi:uncharacterized protein YeaO (DUF488 family)